MSKVIGIDLGTTNSCVAVIENGNPKVIGEIPNIRPAPRIVLGGPGWNRNHVKPAVLVDDLLEACEEISRAVGA